MHKIIGNSPAPKLFSLGIASQGYTVEVSGQIGLKDGVLVEGLREQTIQAFENVKNILNDIERKMENITKIRVYLTSMDDYAVLNEVYAGIFENDAPTRVALAVKALPLGALVELDCTAVGNKLD